MSRQGAGTDAHQTHMFAFSAVLGILANLELAYKEVQELVVANPGRWINPHLLCQPWRKYHALARHGEITSAQMTRFTSNGSPAPFMHWQMLTSLERCSVPGSTAGW